MSLMSDMKASSSLSFKSNLSAISSVGVESLHQEFKDEDYTKDNVKSPVDLEGLIQSQRIAAILESAVIKTKLVIAFRHLFNLKEDILGSILTPEHYQKVKNINEHYVVNKLSVHECKINADDVKKVNFSAETRFSPKMSELISILKQYPVIISMAEAYVLETRSATAIEDSNLKKSLLFLIYMEKIQEQMAERCAATAKEVCLKEMKKNRLERNNKKHLHDIAALQATMAKESVAFESKIKVMKDCVASLQDRLRFLVWQSEDEIRIQTIRSDKELAGAARAQRAKLHNLKYTFDMYTDNLAEIQKFDLSEEQTKRDKVSGAKERLEKWLAMYDLELQTKQNIVDAITKQLDEEQEKADGLEAEMAELDKEYLPAMEAREAEYAAEMKGKMLNFKELHIARILQHVWRTVLFNRVEKKKWRRIQAAIERQRKADKLPTV